MEIDIPTKAEIAFLIDSSIEKALLKILPEAIRKGTRNKWLTTADVMDMLKCSRRHVQHLRDSAQISYSQNNQTIRYDIDEIDRYMDANRVNPCGKQYTHPPF